MRRCQLQRQAWSCASASLRWWVETDQCDLQNAHSSAPAGEFSSPNILQQSLLCGDYLDPRRVARRVPILEMTPGPPYSRAVSGAAKSRVRRASTVLSDMRRTLVTVLRWTCEPSLPRNRAKTQLLLALGRRASPSLLLVLSSYTTIHVPTPTQYVRSD